jgi:hypothetical protein
LCGCRTDLPAAEEPAWPALWQVLCEARDKLRGYQNGLCDRVYPGYANVVWKLGLEEESQTYSKLVKRNFLQALLFVKLQL